MDRPRRVTWVRQRGRGWAAVYGLRDGVAVLPDPYVWYRYQLLVGVPVVLLGVAPVAVNWTRLGLPGSGSTGLVVLVAAVAVEALLLRLARGAAELRRVALGWARPGRLARPPVFGIVPLRARWTTVAEMRRGLAIRGFTEPVLHAGAVRAMELGRAGWMVTATLRTAEGEIYELVRPFPVGQRRFRRVLRDSLAGTPH
ncbi:hypothetical protein SAMN05421810_10467 [Amycolatopsis arida]|uniref:Uncharacterized protein n=1 Tax=Amycolatopsis arida TaxID=587909 RepID=A0A1I5UPU1_9PSEU|nr:hypothetical protein [Amycolatopsis arida]TDX90987.1 hypothetical protein CLV69_10666 [Amycolatopsis arida]SFP97252.1 hypothetical protein SAMN05421810_10467 [Amycolatopsis arida]